MKLDCYQLYVDYSPFNLRCIILDGLWRCATEVNLIKLARRCHRLEVLSIPSCRGVTDKVLKAVSVNCAHLRVLDVSRCHQVGTYMLCDTDHTQI